MRPVKITLYICVLACLILFLVLDTLDDQKRLISASGLVFLMLVTLVFSKHPRQVGCYVQGGLQIKSLFSLKADQLEAGHLGSGASVCLWTACLEVKIFTHV